MRPSVYASNVFWTGLWHSTRFSSEASSSFCFGTVGSQPGLVSGTGVIHNVVPLLHE